MISKEKLINFEKKINYIFKDKNNLINSLTHPSYIKENKLKKKTKVNNHFERLEFLGDRVLGIVISSLIFKKFKNLNEGDLTKKLSYLVQKNFLYKVSLEIGLDKVLLYSFKKQNDRSKHYTQI